MLTPEKRKNDASRTINRIPGGWRGLAALLSAVLLVSGFFLGQAVGAGTSAVPGSKDDPLVTASWVESRLRELSRDPAPAPDDGVPVDLSLYEERLERLENQVAGLEARVKPTEPPRFEVVQVSARQTVLTGHGTEVVVRAGSVRVVGGEGGGFSDLTAGKSLLCGSSVQLNHLLLSARKDGRGLAAQADSLLLIRGDYEIR